MRSSPDLFVRVVRLILRIFFRRVEVVGAERLPLGHPMVLVANHVNSLVDPLFLLGSLPVRPRTLAASFLWNNPIARPWMNWAQAIPVYRQQDKVDTAQNEQTFLRCHELLSQGGAIALFPEGKSHSEPALQPLKTGLARIVLGAERRYPGIETRIVPVGLTFDEKQTFRSRALVQVGHPIDPAPVGAVAAAVRGYDRLLAAVGLRDDQVAAAYPFSPVARFVGRTLLRLLIHLPLAVVGTILNGPGYWLVKPLAHLIVRRLPDKIATIKLFVAILLFPLTWTAEAVLAARAWGLWAAPLVLLAAPLTGWAALRFHETHLIFWREARAYLVLRTRKRVADALRTRRETVLQEVEDLETLWREALSTP
jgi:1-acyl-sn-glycerol-3-phosphate acyltransferase